MVQQYPDTMTWNDATGPDARDADGNPVPGTPVTATNTTVRYENFQAGNRKEFTNRDGETVLATGVVYAKKGSEVPDRFSVITITRNAVVVFTGEVLNVYMGQLNSTLHVLENVGN